ncbi:MAG: hypothetical protein KAG66_21080, partial [Methylococcales bacterium]|nr:hypothetical protein [Methylococcales bacterium]
MRRRSLYNFSIIILFLFFIVGCNSTTPPDDAAATVQPTATPLPVVVADLPLRGQAAVDSIQIQLLESFPIQVNVLARGTLADNCSQIDQAVSQLNGNEFRVVVTTFRNVADEVCIQEIVPFEEIISLDVDGLDAGTYGVNVNGSTGSFTFDVDNRVQVAEPTATSPLVAKLGGVNGRIFHDLCAPAALTAENEENPPEGCVALDDGSWLADGEMGNEPGIENVTVAIGEGACPAAALETAVSDDNGSFSFSDLTPGDYCLSVDILGDGNEDILIPGQWTAPEQNPGSVIETAVTINENISSEDVNFGWDYQFLPVPEVDEANCLNAIQFVDDINIPDDTAFLPGTEFEKTWRLRN